MNSSLKNQNMIFPSVLSFSHNTIISTKCSIHPRIAVRTVIAKHSR